MFLVTNKACHWLMIDFTIIFLYLKVMYKTQRIKEIPSTVRIPSKVSLAVNVMVQKTFLKFLQKQDSDHQIWSFASSAESPPW